VAYIATLGGKTYALEIEEIGPSLYRVMIDGIEVIADGQKTGSSNYSLLIDHRSFEVDVDVRGEEFSVLVDGRTYHLNLIDEKQRRLGGLQKGILAEGKQAVFASMPGKVVEVLVSEGDRVERGEELLIIEAMKMENEIRSPIEGIVKEIHVRAGQSVESGEFLLVVE
jgi:acetyl/propionyl-CoA carboxylase alpha subunit